MPTKSAAISVYQLKITLLEIEPPIWRRMQVPSTFLLCCLHDAFQVVMGWTDSHLHQFEKDGKYWGVPDNDRFEDDIEVIDESKVPVGNVLQAEGDALVPPGTRLILRLHRDAHDPGNDFARLSAGSRQQHLALSRGVGAQPAAGRRVDRWKPGTACAGWHRIGWR